MVSRRVHTLLEQLRAQGIRDELVLDALAAVPREKFIDEAFEHKAGTILPCLLVRGRRFRSLIWLRE